jgi:hypothetical protein
VLAWPSVRAHSVFVAVILVTFARVDRYVTEVTAEALLDVLFVAYKAVDCVVDAAAAVQAGFASTLVYVNITLATEAFGALLHIMFRIGPIAHPIRVSLLAPAAVLIELNRVLVLRVPVERDVGLFPIATRNKFRLAWGPTDAENNLVFEPSLF